MGLAEFFSFGANSSASITQSEELPNIYPLGITREDFVETDVFAIYCKILTDVAERTSGLSDEQAEVLWDNCVMSNSNDGLITLLADAMTNQKELFLVIDSGVLREATSQEKAQIRKDYESAAESKVGVFISFKNYSRTDMVRLYSGLEFCAVDALNKSMNLAKAIQLKISDLRSSVAAYDSAIPRSQASAIAKGLADGRDVMLDAKDEIVTSTPDLTATKTSFAFLESKRAFYLGLPSSYINGEQTGGLNADGSADSKAVERGLKSYYFSVMKPALEALFGVKLKYKSQDSSQITSALEALKTFDLVSNEYLSAEQKKAIIESMLDIPADENETEEPAAPIDVTPPTGLVAGAPPKTSPPPAGNA